MVTYPGLPGPEISEYLSRADSRANYAPGTEFLIGRIDMVGNTGTYLDTPFSPLRQWVRPRRTSPRRCRRPAGLCIEAAGPEIGPEVVSDCS